LFRKERRNLVKQKEMSYKIRFPKEIPQETRACVEALLSEESVYRLIGQEAEQMLGENEFEDMYAEEGRPAMVEA
jgi:hypothetical protein